MILNSTGWKLPAVSIPSIRPAMTTSIRPRFRIRGTNLPAGVPFETDADGSSLVDSEASDNIYAANVADGNGLDRAVHEDALISTVQVNITSKLDDVAEAHADLWACSNAIFVNANVAENDELKRERVCHCASDSGFSHWLFATLAFSLWRQVAYRIEWYRGFSVRVLSAGPAICFLPGVQVFR
jgi:hypothetical protein